MKRDFLSLRRWFTLIEIIIVIMIIWMVLFSISNVDFSRLSEKQKHQVFVNTVLSHLETVRNFAFSGRGIGNPPVVPDSWDINISETNSGAFITNYAGSVSGTYTQTTFNSPSEWYSIQNIRCRNLNDSIQESITLPDSATLSFSWQKISLSGCLNTNLKILEFDTVYNSRVSTIEINTISGVIQVQN